jgi:hypothetical protein
VADKTTLSLGKSREEVALALLKMVGEAEEKLYTNGQTQPGCDREWILQTYQECLKATRTGP